MVDGTLTGYMPIELSRVLENLLYKNNLIKLQITAGKGGKGVTGEKGGLTSALG